MRWTSMTTAEGDGAHHVPMTGAGQEAVVEVARRAGARLDRSSSDVGYQIHGAAAGAETEVEIDREETTTGGGVTAADARAATRHAPAPALLHGISTSMVGTPDPRRAIRTRRLELSAHLPTC